MKRVGGIDWMFCLECLRVHPADAPHLAPADRPRALWFGCYWRWSDKLRAMPYLDLWVPDEALRVAALEMRRRNDAFD